MQDHEDQKLKAEIDAIMSNVESIMGRVESVMPARKKDSETQEEG